MDESRRRELAGFLRARRDRIDPRDAGISPSARRRAAGLRREEVAQLSGVSVTWYTWLEQGRDIKVSEQVLASLAGALRLSEAERAHLYTLAGHQPPAGAGDRQPSSALRRLVDVLSPHPAYLLDPCWDLLAWNDAEAGLIGDPGQRPPAERNLIWLVFTDPWLRAMMTDWPRQARGLLGQYRADVGRYPGDPRFAELTAELRAASAEFRGWWEQHDVAAFLPARWHFEHPVAGPLALDYVKLAALDSPSVRLFTCVPADAETAARLPGLAAASAAAGSRPAPAVTELVTGQQRAGSPE